MATTEAQAVDPPQRRRGRPPRVSSAEIVAVATELFARRGYRGTTLTAIADEIKATDASILHYFPNKAAILDAVLERDDEPGRREFLDLIEPGGIEALRRFAYWGERMEAEPTTTSLLVVLTAEALSESSDLHGRFESRYRYMRSRMVKAIRLGIERGEIKPDVDAIHEATAIIAFVDGIRLQWFLANGRLSIADHLRQYLNDVIARVAA
jgi:AcrR family transcriptional regulator